MTLHYETIWHVALKFTVYERRTVLGVSQLLEQTNKNWDTT